MFVKKEIEIELFPVSEKIDESKVAQYIDAESVKISMNENLDIDFIRRWYEKLDWKTLTINFEFTESELLEFFGSIHWKSAVYCQPACTKDFIKDNNLEYVIEELQSFNQEFMLEAMEQFGNIDNLTVISEKNREIVLEILLCRIHNRIGFTDGGHLELLFEDGSIYELPNDRLPHLLRDLKIETLENNDIIDCIRKTADSFGEKIN